MTSASEELEAIEPTVRGILDDVVIRNDGLAYVENYPSWVMALRKLPAKENSRVFVQLAVVAREFFDAGCKPVAVTLASLARIGLNRLAKQEMRHAPRCSIQRKQLSDRTGSNVSRSRPRRHLRTFSIEHASRGLRHRCVASYPKSVGRAGRAEVCCVVRRVGLGVDSSTGGASKFPGTTFPRPA